MLQNKLSYRTRNNNYMNTLNCYKSRSGRPVTFMMLTLLAFVLALASVTYAPSVHAQQISEEQLEQFRQLPRAQQERLARQYGIDIRMLEQQGALQSDREREREREPDTIFLRGTEFDRDGNPIMPDDILRQFRDPDDELKPFGYDLFAGEPRSFTPLRSAPVPGDYVLGIDDTLKVYLYGKETQQHELIIDREGNILLPEVGVLNVAGMTYSEARNLIHSRVRERMIGYEASVSMGELRSIQIFVTGESYRPGAYSVSALTTITQAIFHSGGVSDIASLRNIQVRRGGRVIETLDLYDFLLHGDNASDIRLKSGDVVFIPTRGAMAAIDGEVRRPALYELKRGETLSDLLDMAGGNRASAYMRTIHVQRVADGQRVVHSVNATNGGAGEFTLRDGDEIRVPVVGDQLDNNILLIGAVSRPGHYEWKEGLRVTDLISSTRHDLMEQADLGYALIVREEGPRRLLKTYQFDVAMAVEGDPSHDLELQPRDQILVFSRYELKENETRNISRLTMTQQDREKEEREKLFNDFRMKYLRDLVRDQDEEDTYFAGRMDARDRVQGLFGQPDDDEEEMREEDYSEYSRHRMLQPVIERITDQGATVGRTPLVYVSGEVRHPGIYPLPENAQVAHMVAAAGGLKDSAYLARAELTRVNIEDGDAVTDFIPVDLADALLSEARGDNHERNIAVQGRDRLNVLSIPEWQNTYEVTLEGEVRFPGTYSVRRGESLRALIERAGGLTDYAFAEGAVFTREELREAEQRRIQNLAQDLQREIAGNVITDTGGMSVSYEETRVLLRDLVSAQAMGRMVIDLPSILADGGREGDISLRDGDRVVIPPRHDSVSVIGEVQLATSHRYNSDLGVSDYLSMSGGTKQKADIDRIYVIRANGAVEPFQQRRGWFSQNRATEMRPGDTIVVPLDSGYKDNMQLWVSSTQIIYQLAVAAAAIGRI